MNEQKNSRLHLASTGPSSELTKQKSELLRRTSRDEVEAIGAAMEEAMILFGCYPSSAAYDADTFVLAVAKTLALYPIEIVRSVCDPITGLPGENKWLPSVAEIREACEKRMQPIYAEARRAKLRGETLELRDRAKTQPEEHAKVVTGFRRLADMLAFADIEQKDHGGHE
jgi:hypothetical protein